MFWRLFELFQCSPVDSCLQMVKRANSRSSMEDRVKRMEEMSGTQPRATLSCPFLFWVALNSTC